MRASSPVETKVLAVIEPAAADLGFRLVRVRVSGLKRKKLQIMAERAADGLMSLADCETLSRAISPLLDVADPIAGEYELEVSSPGIDRPLVSIEDFARFVGHEAKLETTGMADGRRRFKGAISSVDPKAGAIELTLPEGPVRLAFTAIAEARLVLTDRLIADDLRRAAEAERADDKAPPKRPRKDQTTKDVPS